MKKQEIKAEITKFPFDSNWVSGKVGGYVFEAKLFDDSSTFGINNGRVSKLSIYDDSTRLSKGFFASCIVNYDRGWDIRPTKEQKPYFLAVMAALEATPRRFDLTESTN